MTTEERLEGMAAEFLTHLFADILHGDEKHQQWLHDKLHALKPDLIAALRAAQAETWREAANKLRAEMEKENESTDDQVWEFIDYCAQQAQQAETGKEG